ncbi:fasciclin domain-containing protein [Micromonospora sp. WMMD998]|uniref:fasciclin domain-containing protein n=1 Tax=Micromonospora sp. WMMD998 TaxID=3016092 RepID=UPI00249C26D7|nr:fasciclin domain-containing protein [Micromonospora sp. WMMD998]WFE42117.1 fasciclin domain-containing protein [Micromonospora sp. WMMD998]
MRPMRLTSIALAATLSLGLAACGGDGDDSDVAAPASSAPMSSAPASSAPAMADGQFGPGCAAVPTDATNPGSFAAMAQVPVATAASGNPLLSTLVTAVKQAGLVDSLNSAKELTVFAPTDDAFGKLPKADLDKVLADKKMLTDVLTYHVVEGRLGPDQLAGAHKTLQGGEVTVAGSGTEFTINGDSMVVCGNVQTANATVYIVDSVLMPTS